MYKDRLIESLEAFQRLEPSLIGEAELAAVLVLEAEVEAPAAVGLRDLDHQAVHAGVEIRGAACPVGSAA